MKRQINKYPRNYSSGKYHSHSTWLFFPFVWCQRLLNKAWMVWRMYVQLWTCQVWNCSTDCLGNVTMMLKPYKLFTRKSQVYKSNQIWVLDKHFVQDRSDLSSWIVTYEPSELNNIVVIQWSSFTPFTACTGSHPRSLHQITHHKVT